jgi:hypothetical protein
VRFYFKVFIKKDTYQLVSKNIILYESIITGGDFRSYVYILDNINGLARLG